MGKTGEELPAIEVQKCPCLYDKAIPAFHDKNEKKNAWEAVGRDFGFKTSEAAKNAFTSLRRKYLRPVKT